MLICSFLISTYYKTPPKNSPPPNPIGKTYGVAILEINGAKYETRIAGPTVYDFMTQLQNEGKAVSHAHFNYIMPLPKNTEEVLSGFKRILVCELNSGQFVNYLRMKNPRHDYQQFNKVQGLPFMINELTEKFNQLLEDK